MQIECKINHFGQKTTESRITLAHGGTLQINNQPVSAFTFRHNAEHKCYMYLTYKHLSATNLKPHNT